MQRTMKRGGLLLALLVALIATMALAASSASADPFCGGQLFNKVSACWGANRPMEVGRAWGISTGVCVGADTTKGQCAPPYTWTQVWVPYNWHSPWVIGTGSAFTQCGECYTLP